MVSHCDYQGLIRVVFKSGLNYVSLFDETSSKRRITEYGKIDLDVWKTKTVIQIKLLAHKGVTIENDAETGAIAS